MTRSGKAPETSFPSAVDGWLWGIAVGLPLAGLTWAFIEAIVGGSASVGVILLIGLSVLVLCLPIWMLVDTRYIVTEQTLRIRSGPQRIDIPRADIREVRPSRSWLAAPALSLDRLEVRYGQYRSVLVSPRDREGFLEALDVAELREVAQGGGPGTR